MSYAEIFETLPPELQLPIARLVDTLRADLEIKRTEFEDLKGAMHGLAQAQARTEARIEELAQAQARTEARVEELAQAQARTEARIEELAQAQARTEARVEELAQAQARTEARVEELAQAQARTEARIEELAQAQARTEARIEELAQAQARTEARLDKLDQTVEALTKSHQELAQEFTLFRQTFVSQLGGLGARWGLQTEEAFRNGMRTILQEVGFTAERFLTYDQEGDVFGQPDQIELDVVIKNGRLILIEIKSSVDRGHVHLFDRKVQFYAKQTGRQVDRKLIVTPYAEGRAYETAQRLGVELCTDATTLR